jgi:hypothetical protein
MRSGGSSPLLAEVSGLTLLGIEDPPCPDSLFRQSPTANRIVRLNTFCPLCLRIPQLPWRREILQEPGHRGGRTVFLEQIRPRPAALLSDGDGPGDPRHRACPEGTEGSPWEDFVERNNNELVVTWGNLANRMLSFAYRRFEGVVPEPGALDDKDRALLAHVEAGFETVGELYNACKFRALLEPAQQRLPDALNTALEAAVQAEAQSQAEAPGFHLDQALALAWEMGYL